MLCKFNKCVIGFVLVKMDFRVCGEIKSSSASVLPTGIYMYQISKFWYIVLGIYEKIGIYLVYLCRRVCLRLYTK